MRTHPKPIAGLVLWGALAVLSRTAAAEPNVIRGIEVAEKDGGVELAIQGTRAPSYTVFKLQDPPRLVVDLAGADVSQVASPVEVGKAGVVTVSTAQYKDERSAVGRVIVALEGPRRYEVAPRGDAVVVKVLGGAAEQGAATATASETSTPTSTATSTATTSPPHPQSLSPAAAGEREARGQTAAAGEREARGQTAAAGEREARGEAATSAATVAGEAVHPEPFDDAQGKLRAADEAARSRRAPTATDAGSAEPRADDHVVSRRVDEAAVSSPARVVTGVRSARDRIVLATDGQVAKIEVIELRDPARLAVDLHGVAKAPRAPARGGAGFTQVRFGRDGDKVRVVLDAEGALPAYEVKRVRGGVAIVATTKATATPSPRPSPPAGAGAEGAVARAAAARVRISDVRFAQQGGFARIEIAGKAKHAVSRPDQRTVVLSLENAELAKKLERSLDTTAFQGPVMMVSSFNQPATGEVKIVATLRGEASERVAETAAGLSWTFQSTATAAKEAEATPVVRISDAQSAGFAAEAPGYALSGAPQARGYVGRRITLDFHDIEIRNLLRLIADVSKKNIVVADDVSGKVTVSLRNVPWDQALDLILKSKGLGKEEMGNVIRIAKYEQIAKEQEARAAAEKARAPTLPLKVRIIPVNFARAGELSSRVKDVLTERGSVSTDERTNVLIVKDVQEALVRAEGLVRNLDTEIPQVLIESRIIEASSNFNKALGIQWGGSATFTQATGNATGISFPGNVTGTGSSASPNYAVSLPAPVGEGAGGALSLLLGSANGAVNLNLRLSALENNGVVKTISAPKVATIDNKEATIGQGVSIPFSQVSASGVNTTFIEAKLELKVTPHVSSDGSILLKIKATNNSPNPQLTGANGQPSISKREAETEVLVKDGDTTVIGGIYTRQTSSRRAEVPFLGKLPLLGFFFHNTSEIDDHTELLIFITPKILNRSATTAAAAAN